MKPPYLLLFTLIQFHVHAQQFQGVLLDSITHQPIPYVHLLSQGTGIGTITNDDGNFSWDIENDSITFSITHVGYKPKEVMISRKGFHKIYLSEDRIVLTEIAVTDAGYVLATRAMKGLQQVTHYNTGIAFYRQLTTLDEVPNEFIESFHEASFSRKGIHKHHVYQGRYARAKGDLKNPTFSYQNFSTLTFNFEIYSESSGTVLKPFTPESIDLYDFQVAEKFESGGHSYAVVRFTPIEKLVRPYLTGQFIINLDNNKIRNFQVSTRSSLGTDTIQYSGKKDIFGLTKNHQHDWVFQFSDTDSVHCVEYILASARFDLVDPNEQVHQVRTSSKFVVVNVKDVDHEKLKKHDMHGSDVLEIQNKFDKKFWRRTPIIQRTSEEEAVISYFEKKNSFGNY